MTRLEIRGQAEFGQRLACGRDRWTRSRCVYKRCGRRLRHPSPPRSATGDRPAPRTSTASRQSLRPRACEPLRAADPGLPASPTGKPGRRSLPRPARFRPSMSSRLGRPYSCTAIRFSGRPLGRWQESRARYSAPEPGSRGRPIRACTAIGLGPRATTVICRRASANAPGGQRVSIT